jgi:two-component system, chemotaxis family, chemotaxis protein CheY
MPRIALIVEDSDAAASTLEVALARIPGLDSACVAGGIEAWAYLNGPHAEEVCAVLTDLNMPGMDGSELIANVRSADRYRKLPIIVISGSPEPGISARVLSLGANAFFPKPFSPAAVCSKLEELLNA